MEQLKDNEDASEDMCLQMIGSLKEIAGSEPEEIDTDLSSGLLTSVDDLLDLET